MYVASSDAAADLVHTVCRKAGPGVVPGFIAVPFSASSDFDYLRSNTIVLDSFRFNVHDIPSIGVSIPIV